MITEMKTERLISLDVFRGATIAAMILVNNPGSYDFVYPQLLHANWHGWTFTDWIFPFFLFIVGVSLTFSFSGRLKKGAKKTDLIKHTIRRAGILFVLGMIINGFPFGLLPGSEFSLATWRIPGVLQRIALCYLVASLIYLNTTWRGQAYWSIGLLIAYWLVVKIIPVPGFGAGVLSPEGNIVGFIDSNLLSGHTWLYAPVKGFDPEGILSTVPAIASTLGGIITGQWLRSDHTNEEKASTMFVSGNLLLMFGLFLDMWLPINKNLWSSSYAIFMTGWALVCLATIFWLVDVKRYTGFTKPFIIFGMNAITVFMLAELLASTLWSITWLNNQGQITTLHDYIYETFLLKISEPVNASLIFAMIFVMLMYLFAWFMWKKKWFIRI